MCFCLSGCTSIILGLAAVSQSKAAISFTAGGELYKASDDNIGTFRVVEVEGHGFAIAYSHYFGNTENTLDGIQLNLNCGFFDGELKKYDVYHFTTDDRLDAYPAIKHTVEEIIESTPDSSTSRLKTVWLNATEGWFKITKIDKNNGKISVKFSFTAVCDDPDSSETIEITDGILKNIPYVTVQDYGL